MPVPSQDTERVFAELGRCLVAYQSIELMLKLVLPHVSRTEAEARPPANVNWRELLDSKETLGGLLKLFSRRTSSSNEEVTSQVLGTLVQHRNEVVHHFLQQPFSHIETEQQYQEAMRFLSARRATATAFLVPLQALVSEFSTALRSANATSETPKGAA